MKRAAIALLFATFATPASAQSVQPVPWASEQPSARDFRDTYPPQAIADAVEGLVYLDFLITDAYRLDCTIKSETPEGYGFGAAAMRLSQLYVASPEDTRIAIGRRVRVPIRYALAD